MVIGCVWLTNVSVVDMTRVLKIAKKVWRWASGAQRTAQGRDFELILSVKMETKHPVGDHLAARFLHL